MFGALFLLRTSGNGSNFTFLVVFYIESRDACLTRTTNWPRGKRAAKRTGEVSDIRFDRGNPLMLIFVTVGRLRQKNKQRKKKQTNTWQWLSDPFRDGETWPFSMVQWPPTIGDEKVTAWITWQLFFPKDPWMLFFLLTSFYKDQPLMI